MAGKIGCTSHQLDLSRLTGACGAATTGEGCSARGEGTEERSRQLKKPSCADAAAHPLTNMQLHPLVTVRQARAKAV